MHLVGAAVAGFIVLVEVRLQLLHALVVNLHLFLDAADGVSQRLVLLLQSVKPLYVGLVLAVDIALNLLD